MQSRQKPNAVPQRDTADVDGLPFGYNVIDSEPIRRRKPTGIGALYSPTSTILASEKNGENVLEQQIGVLWDKDTVATSLSVAPLFVLSVYT